jgi:hypothetical protein
MSDPILDRSTIIPSVSESLRRFISANVPLLTEATISLDSPADWEETKQNSASLYLYQIEIDPYLRNTPASIVAMQASRDHVPPLVSKPAPLALDLTYMVVAYGTSGEKEQIIANGLANLLDTCGRIPNEYLMATLQQSGNESLAVIPEGSTIHELRDLWAAFTPKTYHLTRLYKVPAVRIPSPIEVPVDLLKEMQVSATPMSEGSAQ